MFVNYRPVSRRDVKVVHAGAFQAAGAMQDTLKRRAWTNKMGTTENPGTFVFRPRFWSRLSFLYFLVLTP